MKVKRIAVVLALAAASWAQTATQTPSAPPAGSSGEKAKCSCCEKMSGDISGMKGAHCARPSMKPEDTKTGDAKDAASCCSKGAKSCMKNAASAAKPCCGDGCTKDKMAASCCGEKCGKDCCSSKKMVRNCCKEETHG
jgi:hypothetical protein